MPSASKPWWQQATALVSLGAGGAVTGLSFVPQPAADADVADEHAGSPDGPGAVGPARGGG